MRPSRIFWRSLLVWTTVVVVGLSTIGLIEWAIAPKSLMTLARFALGTLEHLPQGFALLLPLSAYAAAVAAGSTEPRSASMRTPFLCALGVALLVVVLLGYAAPWLARTMTYDSSGASSHFDTDELDLAGLWSLYQMRLRNEIAAGTSAYDVLQWRGATRLGWYFHQRIATGCMALLTVPFGWLVGRRARPRRGSWALVEVWVIGIVLFIVVSAFVVLGNELTDQRNVSPAAMAWLPLFGPAVALGVLWWSTRHDARVDAP